jgi:DNA-binding transcriptional LysR family regulator
MRCSSGITIRSLMLAGAGIARYPSALVRADVDAGRLARVLPGHSVPGNVLNAVYLQERYRPAKASAFLAHCSEAFRAS